MLNMKYKKWNKTWKNNFAKKWHFLSFWKELSQIIPKVFYTKSSKYSFICPSLTSKLISHIYIRQQFLVWLTPLAGDCLYRCINEKNKTCIWSYVWYMQTHAVYSYNYIDHKPVFYLFIYAVCLSIYVYICMYAYNE